MNFAKRKNSNVLEAEELPLNVFFNYNGHSFDAYEVLGVPAGSTLEEVRSAFDKCLKMHDTESQELFHLAFTAIQQTASKST